MSDAVLGTGAEQGTATAAAATCFGHGSARSTHDCPDGACYSSSVSPVPRRLRASERCDGLPAGNDASTATIPPASAALGPAATATTAATEREHRKTCLRCTSTAAARTRSYGLATTVHVAATKPESGFASDDGSIWRHGIATAVQTAVVTRRSRRCPAERTVLPTRYGAAYATATSQRSTAAATAKHPDGSLASSRCSADAAAKDVGRPKPEWECQSSDYTAATAADAAWTGRVPSGWSRSDAGPSTGDATDHAATSRTESSPRCSAAAGTATNTECSAAAVYAAAATAATAATTAFAGSTTATTTAASGATGSKSAGNADADGRAVPDVRVWQHQHPSHGPSS